MSLEASLLGKPVFAVNGQALDPRTAKGAAMLALLCLAPRSGIGRDQMAALLWSESDDERARASLRQTLRQLQQSFEAVGYKGLEPGKQVLCLNPDKLRVDVTEILAALDRGVVDPRLLQEQLLHERLCAGCDHLDPALSEELRTRRTMLGQRLRTKLEPLVDAGHLEAARALLLLDPSHEPAARMVMRGLAAKGDTAGALRVYATLCNVLHEEFDQPPSPETEALHARIAAEVPNDPIASSLPIGQTPVMRLGVAPFDGGDPAMAQVLRHALLAQLTRFREWSIIDLNSGADPASCAFVLQGSLMGGDDTVILNLTLADRRSGVIQWGDGFNFTGETPYAAHMQIIQRIAGSLNVGLSRARLSQITTMPEVTLDHYSLWLRAMSLSFRWNPADEAEAKRIFERLIVEASGFAPAYASLAQTLNAQHLIFPGRKLDPSSLRRALALAERAHQIDPLDSRSLLAMGWSCLLLGTFGRARESFENAYELNENDPWTAISAAHGLAFCADPQTAAAMLDRAVQLQLLHEPLQWGYAVGINYLAGRWQAALDAYDRAGEAYLGVSGWRIAALSALGQVEAARAAVQALGNALRPRWAAVSALTPAALSGWLCSAFPMANPQARRDFARHLAQAGLPQAPNTI